MPPPEPKSTPGKTDLRRRHSALRPPSAAPRTAIGAAEEALLFGESARAIPQSPPADSSAQPRHHA